MLESRKESVRNLVAMAGSGWLSSSRGVRIPEDSSFAVPAARWRRAPRKKRTGGPFTTGVPCNPEIGVGLMAAVVEPASACLRVAEPVRAGARSIMALTTDLCCNGACDTPYCGTPRTPFRIDESMLACRLCSRHMGGKSIYMYMDTGFCTPECRYEFFLEELFEQRRKLVADVRAGKRARRAAGKAMQLTKEEDWEFRRIFFTSDEAESFP